jgi:hypothetical protein
MSVSEIINKVLNTDLLQNEGLKDILGLTNGQFNLVVIGLMTLLFQIIVFYYMNPDKFNYKYAIYMIILSIIYNIIYFKFFVH